jgi:hypothetical protein
VCSLKTIELSKLVGANQYFYYFKLNKVNISAFVGDNQLMTEYAIPCSHLLSYFSTKYYTNIALSLSTLVPEDDI